MRKNIIKLIEDFLAKNTRIFFNENEFQMYLAIYLKESGYEVFVEYRVDIPYKNQELLDMQAEFINKQQKCKNPKPLSQFVNAHPIYLDIVVFDKQEKCYMPIELKYKTSDKADCNTCRTFGVGAYRTIENQMGAHNEGCYDYWRDVERVETIYDLFSKQGANMELGVAVILSNDRQYWELPVNPNATSGNNYYDFSLKNKRVVNLQTLKWQNVGSKGSRKYPITISGNHTVDWSNKTHQRLGSFEYLILPR